MYNFDEKIDSFKNHKKYKWLRKYADKAKADNQTYGLESVIAQDFIERIVAMPLNYIEKWLNGENELEWKPDFRARLKAIKGGFLDLFEQYPNYEIHKIREGAENFYKNCGYRVLKREKDLVFVGK